MKTGIITCALTVLALSAGITAHAQTVSDKKAKRQKEEIVNVRVWLNKGEDKVIDGYLRSALVNRPDNIEISLTTDGKRMRYVNEDVDSLLRCGADKVGVNTAAINDPTLISRVAERFGNQVLVLSVDARREQGERHTQSGFEVTTMGGRKSTGIDAIWWVKRAQELGAGEILLNSMDADGTQQGFDLEMIKAVRKEVKIPIIASGGAGKASDFPPAIEAGADAVLAASIFHYGKVTIGEVKDAIKAAGYTVR